MEFVDFVDPADPSNPSAQPPGVVDLFQFIPMEKARGENAGGLDLFQLLDRTQGTAAPADADGSTAGSTKGAIKEHIKNAGSRLGTEAGSRLASLLG